MTRENAAKLEHAIYNILRVLEDEGMIQQYKALDFITELYEANT